MQYDSLCTSKVALLISGVYCIAAISHDSLHDMWTRYVLAGMTCGVAACVFSKTTGIILMSHDVLFFFFFWLPTRETCFVLAQIHGFGVAKTAVPVGASLSTAHKVKLILAPCLVLTGRISLYDWFHVINDRRFECK